MAGVNWQGAEPVYRTVIGAVLAVFKAMDWRVRTISTEHVPADGPAVIASNHIGYLDFVFVGFGARDQGRLVRFMAKQPVFEHPLAGPLMRAMKHIPVDRYGDPMAAFREAVRRLRAGQIVGMFPEGTISQSFVPRAGKTGSARMAMEAGAPLIPAAVWGTQRILTKNRPKNIQRGLAIDVHYGPAIDYDADDDATEVTKRLMAAINDLTEEAIAGYPQVPAGDDDRWWQPAHLGGSAPTIEEAERRAREERERKRARRQRRNRG